MEDNKAFKTLAKEAKIRFKNGYWQEFCTNKQKIISKGILEGKNEEELSKSIIRQAKNDIKKTFNHQTDDDIFYGEVCELLSSDEIIFNPIKRLINHSIYDNLCQQEKSAYILNLTSKFQQMRERYYKENAKIS